MDPLLNPKVDLLWGHPREWDRTWWEGSILGVMTSREVCLLISLMYAFLNSLLSKVVWGPGLGRQACPPGSLAAKAFFLLWSLGETTLGTWDLWSWEDSCWYFQAGGTGE